MNSALPSHDGLLYVLDLSGGRILTVKPDGSDCQALVLNCRHPDGIVIDAAAGHLYWTDMGVPHLNDGAIERIDLDASNRCTIVPPGATFTPKQLHLDRRNRKLYWCDREGMRVMRCDLDGGQLETLVQTGDPVDHAGDQDRWCVGIAVDAERGHIYWSQKGADDSGRGRIFRAGIDVPDGASPARRSDIELLYEGLPEPIDIELDLRHRLLYWTDRGDPPRGNTVNRAPMDAPAGGARPEPEILFSHLMEGIGIALDLDRGRMYMTDLGGSVYSARLDGSDRRTLLYAQGNLTGIAYAAPR